MARVFISYSRVNKPFVEELVTLLGRVYSDHEIWFDEDISGGEDWWQRILVEITRCDLFIYMMSNNALESEYCQAEFREALRLQKMCLPVVVVPKTDVSLAPPALEQEIRRREWVNMSGGFRDYQANAKLYAAINRLLNHPQVSLPPLSNEPVSKPDVSVVQMRAVRRGKRFRRLRTNMVIGLISILLAVLVIAVISPIGNQRNSGAVTLEQLTVSSFPILTDVPAANEIHSITPTLEIVLIVGTMDAEATIGRETVEANKAAAARATSYAAGTQDMLDQTATVMFSMITPTQTNTLVTKATFTSALSPEVIALTPVSSNDAWNSVEFAFNGVEMVLVPAGCFIMGNDPQAYYWNGGEWIEGVPYGGQQCFTQPFWIDRYEVTNEQFSRMRGVAKQLGDWPGSRQPRTNVTWFEARDFCEKNREARLPTEVEWEYAARGPAQLIYPWGNAFVAGNVVYSHNSGGMTAEVGSKLGGGSWVGAYDLSGNVWEWVRTMDKDYPYMTHDGREDEADETRGRMLRGGSWYNDGAAMRAATRLWADPSVQDPHGGFRCASS